MLDKIMERLELLENDVSYYADDDTLYITVNDFSGFDNDWNEIFCDYNEEGVRDLMDTLADLCNKHTSSFRHVYYFDYFTVYLGFASCDI